MLGRPELVMRMEAQGILCKPAADDAGFPSLHHLQAWSRCRGSALLSARWPPQRRQATRQ